jgi:hypothetical protein
MMDGLGYMDLALVSLVVAVVRMLSELKWVKCAEPTTAKNRKKAIASVVSMLLSMLFLMQEGYEWSLQTIGTWAIKFLFIWFAAMGQFDGIKMVTAWGGGKTDVDDSAGEGQEVLG